MRTITASNASNASNAEGTSRTRRPALAVLVFGLTLLTLVSLSSAPASAQSWSWGGYSGQVAVTPYVTANGATRRITINPSTVGKSPQYAQYNQYVCLTSTLWQIVFVGAGASGQPFWKPVNNYRRCGWISGSSTALVDWGNSFAAGYGGPAYSVTLDVTWQLSNGATVGTKQVAFNSTWDYRCVNGNCMVSNTYWGGGASVFFPSY